MAAHDITNAVDVKGRYAVAAVDFHSTRLYAIDAAPESSPERIGAFDAEFVAIAREDAATKLLATIPGVGAKKLEAWGDAFLDVIRQY